MKPQHIRLDRAQPVARFSATHMPQLEFRQALFHTPQPGWQKRLYPATLLVSTTAYDADGRVLASDHQSMRFALLYDHTWPEALFLNIRRWPYRPLRIKPEYPVAGYIVEMKLRDLRLGEDEYVEVAFLG